MRHYKWCLTRMSYNSVSPLFPYGNCFNHLITTEFPESLLFTCILKHFSYYLFSVLVLLKCSYTETCSALAIQFFIPNVWKKKSLYLGPYCTLLPNALFFSTEVKYQKWGRLLCPDDTVSGSVTEEREDTSQYRLWERKSL